MTRKLLALAALISATSSACSSYQLVKPDKEPIAAMSGPPEGLGQICVLRPHWIAAAVTFVVRDNGAVVGATRGPTYFCYFAEPGLHKITTESDSIEESTLTVAAGGNYYLHQIVDNIMGVVRSRSVWVAPSEAPKLVEKCGYRVVASVPGNEVLPAAVPLARSAPLSAANGAQPNRASSP